MGIHKRKNQTTKKEGIKTNRNWKILTKRKRNLDEKGKERLEELLKKHKQLEIIHTAKEKAYETFKRQSVEEYREKLEELKEYVKENNIQEFKKSDKDNTSMGTRHRKYVQI